MTTTSRKRSLTTPVEDRTDAELTVIIDSHGRLTATRSRLGHAALATAAVPVAVLALAEFSAAISTAAAITVAGLWAVCLVAPVAFVDSRAAWGEKRARLAQVERSVRMMRRRLTAAGCGVEEQARVLREFRASEAETRGVPLPGTTAAVRQREEGRQAVGLLLVLAGALVAIVAGYLPWLRTLSSEQRWDALLAAVPEQATFFDAYPVLLSQTGLWPLPALAVACGVAGVALVAKSALRLSRAERAVGATVVWGA